MALKKFKNVQTQKNQKKYRQYFILDIFKMSKIENRRHNI